MTGGVLVNVPRLRREIVLRGWRPTDLARAAQLSPGTMTAVMKGGPVSPGHAQEDRGSTSSASDVAWT
jgi:hypothetical protein